MFKGKKVTLEKDFLENVSFLKSSWEQKVAFGKKNFKACIATYVV